MALALILPRCAVGDAVQEVAPLKVAALAKVDNLKRSFSCTGALLNARVVITAKHCVQFPNSTDPQSVTEISVAITGAVATHQLEVERIVALNGLFNSDLSGELLGRDIALIILKEDLPEKLILEFNIPDKLSNAGFWIVKLQKSGSSGYTVIYSPVEILERDSHQIYTLPITCEGDSGAPLISGNGELIGIASAKSFGPCGSGTSIFTFIGPHLDFVNLVIKNNASNPLSKI